MFIKTKKLRFFPEKYPKCQNLLQIKYVVSITIAKNKAG